MNKKDILKVLDFAAFILIFIATGLILIFEFSGDFDLIYLAVITFFIGILALDSFLIARVCMMYKKPKTSEESKETKSDENTNRQLSSKEDKKQKTLLFIELAAGVVAFVLILIALINF